MNTMNGKPVIGAPRPLYGSKKRLAYEPEPELRAEEPINFAEMRQIVERAIRRGILTPGPVEEPIVRRAPVKRGPVKDDYGQIPCGICGTQFTRRSIASKFCEPCKWDPRPCITCGTQFVPRSGPKHGGIMQTCSKICQSALQSVRRKGKAPANKGTRRS
jgi:hypothetical protein